MTRIFDDPARFSEDALAGFCDLHAALVRPVDGGVVRRESPERPKVAVLAGGGSGHYPAFAGLVGRGLADGAVVGNIFTSPSAQQAYSVAKAAESGAGVVFSYGNYAGDVMNFGLASERLSAEGVRVANVIVTDDIASAPEADAEKRRGIAGDFTVFKVMGAAAEAGADLDDVVRVGRKANRLTRTIGTAFHGCTFPGAHQPLFSVPEGQMGLGLGIHGEPGLFDTDLPSATELGRELVQRVLAERPEGAGSRLAVLLNGLGSTKHEELFVLWRVVAPLLREAGYSLVMPEVGELVTSLDMAGVSLTLTWLDEELEELWTAPAHTPAYRRGAVAAGASTGEASVGDVRALSAPAGEPARTAEAAGEAEREPVVPAATLASRTVARAVVVALDAVRVALHDAEASLGDLDAIAGDGDHGRGMVRGIDAAFAAGRQAAEQDAGAGTVLAAAGDAWAAQAGGTSGVLWGAGLRAFGEVVGDSEVPQPAQLARAVDAFTDRILALGKAEPGDKTLVDALLPFARTLHEALAAGEEPSHAWREAADAATEAAEASATLSPRKGRARPLAAKSIGTPDPGATSFALIVTVLAQTPAPALQH